MKYLTIMLIIISVQVSCLNQDKETENAGVIQVDVSQRERMLASGETDNQNGFTEIWGIRFDHETFAQVLNDELNQYGIVKERDYEITVDSSALAITRKLGASLFTNVTTLGQSGAKFFKLDFHGRVTKEDFSTNFHYACGMTVWTNESAKANVYNCTQDRDLVGTLIIQDLDNPFQFERPHQQVGIENLNVAGENQYAD